MIPDKIKQLMQKLLDNGFEAYIIGGAVRDYYMVLEPHDHDIFTNATGEQILNIFPNGNIIGGEERQKKILTVIVDGVEISQYRSNSERTEVGGTLEQHQGTCDFTINCLACDINGKLCGDESFITMGKKDIKDKCLRFVGNAYDRIKEDPLRVLRGIRFMLKYNLDPIISTINAITTSDISSLPKERIRDELMKILSLELKEGFLRDIAIFLPKEIRVDNMFKFGGDYHNESPYVHLEKTCLEAVKITNNPLIRLSALLHDVGKGVARTEEYSSIQSHICEFPSQCHLCKKEIHFYGHENFGADIVKKWMKEYKFSEKDTKYVSTMIRLHMYTYKDNPGKKSYIRFFNALEEAEIDIEDYIMQIYSDHQGNTKKPRIKFGDFIKGNWLHKKYYEIKFSEEPMTVKDLKVTGKDVIECMGLKPGPKVGIMLQNTFELVMDGTIKNTRAELLNVLKTTKIGEK